MHELGRRMLPAVAAQGTTGASDRHRLQRGMSEVKKVEWILAWSCPFLAAALVVENCCWGTAND